MSCGRSSDCVRLTLWGAVGWGSVCHRFRHLGLASGSAPRCSGVAQEVGGLISGPHLALFAPHLLLDRHRGTGRRSEDHRGPVWHLRITRKSPARDSVIKHILRGFDCGGLITSAARLSGKLSACLIRFHFLPFRPIPCRLEQLWKPSPSSGKPSRPEGEGMKMTLQSRA